MKGFKRKIYACIDAFAYRIDLKRRADKSNYRGSRFAGVTLTKDEESQVRKVWDKWGGNYGVFRFYKRFCGSFSPFFVPNDYYDFAEHVFNLRWAAFFLQHKCNLKLFIPQKNRVRVILQKIDGHYLREDNTEISESEAKMILLSEPVFMAKVARGSGGGKGVKRVDWKQIDDKDEYVCGLLQPIDMEFESVLHQSDFMAQFNSDSVNTLRLVTLNINGRCSVLSTFLRMGAKGSFVDNLSGGKGVLVGVKQDGSLHDFGITKRYEKRFHSPSGVCFKGIVVPDFERIKETVMSLHKRIPYANLIGWDIALDSSNTVIVIEVNLDSAEIEAHQVFNGPVFGERLDEVMEYVRERTPLIRHQMITY